jgi:hypothetical protein
MTICKFTVFAMLVLSNADKINKELIMMCKRRINDTPTIPEPESYTGETVRLPEPLVKQETSEQACAWYGGFPWWTLWLIWPLISLIKMGAPLLTEATIILNQISDPLLPLILIAVAILFLRRR